MKHTHGLPTGRLSLVTPRLIRKKPFFLFRVAWRLFSQNVFGTRKLRSILFHTHYVCNFSCKHCYEKNFQRTSNKLLTLKEKKRVIKEALRLGVVSFDFVGGESVLDPNLPELIKACKPHKTYITMATNGYGYTEEKIKRLMDMGIDKLNVSVDSFFPKEHDEIRQKEGSHAEALKTIKLCKKTGMGHHMTIFVYKNSTKTEGFKKLIDYAVENNIRVALKLAIPLGKMEGDVDSLVTKEDRQVVEELYKKYPTVKVCDYGNRSGGCPAFDEAVTITAYGDVLPCNGIHISFGNVRDERIWDIVEKGRNLKYFSGVVKGCPPAEDKAFIDSYLSKTYNADPYPIKADKVFDELGGGQLSGEVVLIVAGSYEGVCKSLALKAEEMGATVVVVARSKNETNKELFKRVGNIYVFPFDLTAVEKVPELYDNIIKGVGKPPSVIINDIRYQIAGPVATTSPNSYNESYRVNALFLIALIQCAVPNMLKQKKGMIATIVSAVMYHSYPGLSAYYAAKSALGAIHESLKAELYGTPIKTLYIKPGGFLSNYWKTTTVNHFKDFSYPGIEDLRDVEYLSKRILNAIAEGKEELNLGSIKDRGGYHLSYWMPKYLEKMIFDRNKKLMVRCRDELER